MKNLFTAHSIKGNFSTMRSGTFFACILRPRLLSRRSRPPAFVQNGGIEGIQFSSEPGKEPEEKVITCYFIFRDSPPAISMK